MTPIPKFSHFVSLQYVLYILQHICYSLDLFNFLRIRYTVILDDLVFFITDYSTWCFAFLSLWSTTTSIFTDCTVSLLIEVLFIFITIINFNCWLGNLLCWFFNIFLCFLFSLILWHEQLLKTIRRNQTNVWLSSSRSKWLEKKRSRNKCWCHDRRIKIEWRWHVWS